MLSSNSVTISNDGMTMTDEGGNLVLVGPKCSASVFDHHEMWAMK